MLTKIIDFVGGQQNIELIERCNTRLRVHLFDIKKFVENSQFEYIIIGNQVQFLIEYELLENLTDIGQIEVKPISYIDNIVDDIEIYKPCNGYRVPLQEHHGKVFQQQLIGPTIIFTNENNEVYSPVNGVVKSIFPTLHSYNILASNNTEIIIHIGIDSFRLGADAFTCHIEVGDKVEVGTPIATINSKEFKKNNCLDDIVIITKLENIIAQYDFDSNLASIIYYKKRRVMSSKNQKLAIQIVENIGGVENISKLTYCATRLRLMLVDNQLLNKESLEAIEGVLGVQVVQGTNHIIIGPAVEGVYNEIAKMDGFTAEDEAKVDENPDASFIDKALNAISAIFTPYIPVLASAGILQGFLSLATQFGWLSAESGTYATLNAAATSLIYFFPILLAFTAAKRFGANPYIGSAIGAALFVPSLTAVNVTGQELNVFGITIIGQSFENSVLPILVAMLAFSFLEKGLKKVLPEITHLILVPVISLVVMVPATLIVFGPFGFAISTGIANIYQWLLDFNIVVMQVIFGAFFIYVIMLGFHWVILPIQLSILAEQGMEYSLASGGLGNYALLGVCFAVFLATKDKQTRAMAGSASFVNFLSGITEPGLYGIAFKNKMYFVFISLAGAVGGLIMGLTNTYITSFAFSGLLGSPAFIASPKAVTYFISVGVTLAISFVLTFLYVKKENS